MFDFKLSATISAWYDRSRNGPEKSIASGSVPSVTQSAESLC